MSYLWKASPLFSPAAACGPNLRWADRRQRKLANKLYGQFSPRLLIGCDKRVDRWIISKLFKGANNNKFPNTMYTMYYKRNVWYRIKSKESIQDLGNGFVLLNQSLVDKIIFFWLLPESFNIPKIGQITNKIYLPFYLFKCLPIKHSSTQYRHHFFDDSNFEQNKKSKKTVAGDSDPW